MGNKKIIYGVLGHPVSHSLSPAMHAAAFKALGIQAEYHRFDIPPDALALFFQKMRTEKMAGLSVTAPHKEAIILFLDQIDPVAKEIGAVNTVVREGNFYCGYNTDWIGVQKALPHLNGKKVCILGAGGAARAVIYACIKAGAQVTIVNRTREKAVALAQKYDCTVGDFRDAHRADVIINTTSASEPLLTKKDFHTHQTVMDCMYDPPETLFLKLAKETGAQTLNGSGMLLHQGAAQCALWTKKKAPLAVMREALGAQHLEL